MIFWDTSAIVSLLLDDSRSKGLRSVLEEDRRMVVWWSTPVECWSAVARLRREDRITAADERKVERVLDRLRDSWVEVEPTEEVRAHARRLLRTHALRAGDALQLAAAIAWSGSPPSGRLASLDDRLSNAARIEGFEVVEVGPEGHRGGRSGSA